MALPQSDQRDFVCAARECGPSQLSSDPARVPAARRYLGQSLAHLSLTSAREHRAENGPRRGPPVPRLSLCDAPAKIDKSRQGRPHTQAHMGNS